ncbi:hypothetical protein QFC19_009172 [Naganishia cerealis]|uniref:Uncharacterized protein n=1 Tax=Naganishia cerealis TaxID=610337 RepID=A0ACC2UY45_9TREE|nr:hypothetical protein QFC19_009172 [Naganishia cerealis]
MSVSEKAPTLKEFVQVLPIGPNVYESVYCCEAMGNVSSIGYGGCLLSQCVSAAFANIPQDTADRIYDVYSVLGTFLGPTSTKAKVQFRVEDVRTTKSFATRKVEAWQDFPTNDGGSDRRRTMILLADFHVREPSSAVLPGMTYSIPPVHPESCLDDPDTMITQQQYLATKQPKSVEKPFNTVFPLFYRYLEMKPIQTSMGVQKALGLNSRNKTTQDDLALQQRTNAHWFKVKEVEGGKGELTARSEQAAAVAFVMDSALAFLPLTFCTSSTYTLNPAPSKLTTTYIPPTLLARAAHRFFDAVQAVSTLEFSLRFFDVPNANDWLLHEQHTENGGMGRTFSTGRVWNREGKCIASMSQQCIMRAKAQPGETAKL